MESTFFAGLRKAGMPEERGPLRRSRLPEENRADAQVNRGPLVQIDATHYGAGMRVSGVIVYSIGAISSRSPRIQ